jgi:hypothetical protein
MPAIMKNDEASNPMNVRFFRTPTVVTDADLHAHLIEQHLIEQLLLTSEMSASCLTRDLSAVL